MVGSSLKPLPTTAPPPAPSSTRFFLNLGRTRTIPLDAIQALDVVIRHFFLKMNHACLCKSPFFGPFQPFSKSFDFFRRNRGIRGSMLQLIPQ